MLMMDNANTHKPLRWIDRELETLAEEGLRRRLSVRDGVQEPRIVLDGRELINFGSNDYLGLASDPRVVEAAVEAIRRDGLGSGASPLICGRGRTHRELEGKLAEFEGTEAALVFPSGYAANVGSIGALAGPGDAVFTDAKNHASLWDGCRLSRADVRVYPHADLGRLVDLLDRSAGYRRRLIASDTLFSMDGDVAPLVELARLARRHDAMLLVDEAHATGVFGERGRGLSEHFGVEGQIHVRVGTLSKALGSAGGFVAGSRSLIDWLANRARPYVFSTAGPAAAAAAAVASLEIVRDEPHRRRELLRSATELRRALAERGWNLGASVSQIIPVIVGETDRAMELSASLRQDGLFVPAVRPPTVPEGEACLRISLGWGHTPEMVGALVAALGRGG
jgi:8-amino-7-oxononanoate synthase